MSETNREVVQRGYEERSAGRIAAWMETLDPDIEWDIEAFPIDGFPVRGAGRSEFVGHVTRYWSIWNDYSQDVEEMIEAGDRVVVVLREHARKRNSDVDIEREVATVWTISGGRRVRFEAFPSRAEALRAVGIGEAG